MAIAMGLSAVAGFLVVYREPPRRRPQVPVDRAEVEQFPLRGTLASAPSFSAGRSVPTNDDVQTYFPRDENEWQGMLVGVMDRPYCEKSELCGLAGACVDNLCGPCRTDSQCGPGEVCVLDYCLLSANVACRSRRECFEQGSLCVLSGISSDARGNATMTSRCLAPRGGVAQREEDLPEVKRVPVPRPAVDTLEMVDSVRQLAKNRNYEGAQ